jgi:membrane-associated phospholipid phosphatase
LTPGAPPVLWIVGGFAASSTGPAAERQEPIAPMIETGVQGRVAAHDQRPGRRTWIRWSVPALLLASLVALGVMVNQGALHSIDHYAYRQQPIQHSNWQSWTDPAEIPFAALILLAALIKMRQRPRLVALWIAAFGASLVIEVIGKALVERPFAATNTFLGTSIVQGSFPSGHTMRAIVVAGAVGTAWPRLRWPAIAWAAFTAVMVEVSGMHSPSEVIGGILGGLAIVTAVWASGGTQRESPPRPTHAAAPAHAHNALPRASASIRSTDGP